MRPQVLTVPEMAARLGISRFTLYLRIKCGETQAFRSLHGSGPWRFLVGAGKAVRPLPHFHRRPAADVPWATTAEVAGMLRVSPRIVQAACAAGFLEVQRSPGARLRARYVVALDAATRLPLPAGTLLPVSRSGRSSTNRR